MPKIMYCCEICFEESPEHCAHANRDMLRTDPEGKWLCADCWADDHTLMVAWDQADMPPEAVLTPSLEIPIRTVKHGGVTVPLKENLRGQAPTFKDFDSCPQDGCKGALVSERVGYDALNVMRCTRCGFSPNAEPEFKPLPDITISNNTKQPVITRKVDVDGKTLTEIFVGDGVSFQRAFDMAMGDDPSIRESANHLTRVRSWPSSKKHAASLESETVYGSDKFPTAWR